MATAGELSHIRKALDKMQADGLNFQYDDGEGPLKPTVTVENTMKELHACDEEWIWVYRDGKFIGQIALIYGNDPSGEEVIADYHTSLEKWLA